MSIKIGEKLIANRMNVAFVLFLCLMASCIVSSFIENQFISLLLPLFTSTILIFWLAYSKKEKAKLINNNKLSSNYSDFLEEIEKHNLKENSVLKRTLAAYGLTVGIFILVITVLVLIAPDFIEVLVSSNLFYLLIFVIMVVSYQIMKKKLK